MSRVINADKLAKKLENIKNLDLTPILTNAAIIVENEAKLKCPVGDTGILRNSITHEVEGNKAYVGTNISYAPYVEIGTGIFAGTDGKYGTEYLGTGRQTR